MRWIPALTVCWLLFGGTASAAEWQRDGLAWRVVLTDDDVQELRKDAAIIARWVPDPTARTAIAAAAEVLDLVNEIGHRNGIEVSGLIGAPGAFVWPATGTTPFVRLVAFQEDARRDISDGAKKWSDLTQRVGGKITKQWEQAGQFVLRANPDGTVSLAGAGVGDSRFKLIRQADGTVCLSHTDGRPCSNLPSIGPTVRGVVGRLTNAANGAVKWTLRFSPDGRASLIPHRGS